MRAVQGLSCTAQVCFLMSASPTTPIIIIMAAITICRKGKSSKAALKSKAFLNMMNPPQSTFLGIIASELSIKETALPTVSVGGRQDADFTSVSSF